MERRTGWGIGLTVLIVIGLVGGAVGGWLAMQWIEDEPADSALTNVPSATVTALAARPFSAQTEEQSDAMASPPVVTDEQVSAVEVVERVAPAVVTVINARESQSPFAGGEEVPAGSGTGFVIDDEGHIVTNWHVVTGSDDLFVIFENGERRDAELVGSDEISDLAVIQVDGNLPGIVPLGDSDALQPGQTVLAIGSPLGQFTNTVTRGIVSALGRSLAEQQGNPELTGLIQHDAAINPGNSGGPLFTLAGEVVGVNTLGLPQTQSGVPVQGLFFAIASNTVKEIAGKLIETGEVRYPFLGIAGPQSINPQIASQNDLPVDYGVYIREIVPGAPADEAGIAAGDIILAIDGERIDQDNSLTEVLFRHEPGETVSVTIQRGSETLEVEMTLGERSVE
ncbi:MAG: S1C family serine protease [Thermomicrobiales bacterium]